MPQQQIGNARQVYSPDSTTLTTKFHSTLPGILTDEPTLEKAASLGSATVAGQKQLIQNECVSSQDNIKCTLQDKYSPNSNTLKTKIDCSTRPGTPTEE